jgi:hypothetical protein
MALSAASVSKPPRLTGNGKEQAVFSQAASATEIIIMSK